MTKSTNSHSIIRYTTFILHASVAAGVLTVKVVSGFDGKQFIFVLNIKESDV